MRAFEVAARHLSFSGAGRELGVTPSAVSQQVRLLEHHLGAALFDRLPRGLALTLAGETYLPIVAESFERLSRGTQALFGATDRERLTVRSAAGFARFWLLPRLLRFVEAHPEIILRIASSTWGFEPFEADIDLEIRFGVGPWPGFRAERLTWDQVFPVCSPVLLKGRQRIGSPADLARYCLFHTIGFREGWGEWLAAAGLPRLTPEYSIEFDSAVMSIELAMAGEGIALGRSSLVDVLLSRKRLVAPFPLRIESNEGFHLLWPASRRPISAIQLFRDWVLTEAAATPAA
ncbi:MAG: LysR substrate-binding domain-containing protein [Rhodospirillales bacterium]|nr:LysR substrate-binding domain-containing protein [Rhodospirillales bacterium]